MEYREAALAAARVAKMAFGLSGAWQARAWLLVLMLLPGLAGGMGPARAGEDVKSLAGQLLVASEKMGDPRFDQAVIYMVEHDGQGAMGLIVNVPMGEVPYTALFDRLGMESKDMDGGINVYYGGPVDPGRGFLLHSTDVLIDGSYKVSGEVALTSQPDMLNELAHGKGPAQNLFALGYAGWGPGQLESELARDAWFVVPADMSLVFSKNPSRSWLRAAARRGLDL